MSKIILGILGGGQLGRMSAQAASKLGIRTIIYNDKAGTCAEDAAEGSVIAPFDDEVALKSFADQVDYISYEFENIPVSAVEYLKQFKPVFPDSSLLEISQNRIDEKSYLNSIGIETANWAEINSAEEIEALFDTWQSDEFILKTIRFGYDGKGQAKVCRGDDYSAVWETLGAQTLIAESIVDFTHELSVIVARDTEGGMVHYGPMLNHHKNHILHETIFPAPFDDMVKDKAVAITRSLAERINLRGVLCLEMFLTADGQILANEIAPRTHNSGHWTIDGCEVSQFENHVRAVCGLPVAEPNPKPARMLNLIGDDIRDTEQYKEQNNAFVHDYGKNDAKPGRKMGHVTFLEE